MKPFFSKSLIQLLSTRRNIVIGMVAIPLGFLVAGLALNSTTPRHYNNFSGDRLQDAPPPALADRSPGHRTGDTLQKKPYNRTPVFEQVLSEVREPVPFEAPLAFGPFDMFGPAGSLIPQAPNQFSSLTPSGPVALGPLPLAPSSVDYPAIGGPAPGQPTSGVPELSTWAMMIIGFFGSGLVARRRMHDRQRRNNGEESHGLG